MNANEAAGEAVEDSIEFNYQEMSAVRLLCLSEHLNLTDSLKRIEEANEQ